MRDKVCTPLKAHNGHAGWGVGAMSCEFESPNEARTSEGNFDAPCSGLYFNLSPTQGDKKSTMCARQQANAFHGTPPLRETVGCYLYVISTAVVPALSILSMFARRGPRLHPTARTPACAHLPNCGTITYQLERARHTACTHVHTSTPPSVRSTLRASYDIRTIYSHQMYTMSSLVARKKKSSKE